MAHRDLTYSVAVTVDERTFIEPLTLRTGYIVGDSQIAGITLCIGGRDIALTKPQAKRIADEIQRRLAPEPVRETDYVRDGAQMFTFPPGVFRDSNRSPK